MDIEPASTVDEDLVESEARDYRLQDEWKPSWFREACPVIRAGECNGYFRPPERGQDRWFNALDFSSGGLMSPSVG
jgi:hypothetical protein